MRVFHQLRQLVLSDCPVLEIKFLATVADSPQVAVGVPELCIYLLQDYCELLQIQLLFKSLTSP